VECKRRRRWCFGFLVGGVLVDVFGWRAVFWVNVPVGVLLVVAVWLLVPASSPVDQAAKLDPTWATQRS
jgi:predicted MFS family arabinose efflux permease